MANLQAFINLGWSPELARATTVGITGFQVVGWIGGNGTAPVTGQYVGTASLVTNITDMANFGGAGAGSINVSAGTTSNLLTNLVFANSNSVSFGLSNSTVTAAFAQSSLLFSNSNNVSFGINAGTLTASATFPAGTNSSWTVSDALTSQTIGRLAFTNANGMTMTLSTSNNGNATVFASYSVPSTAGLISAINVSAGASSSNVTALIFNNSNGVSFGYDGTNITATVATNYQSSGNYLTTAMRSDAATISNINISAPNTSANLSNFVFANSNGVTFGLSGSTVTASVPAGVAPTSWTVSDAVTSQTIGRLAFTNANGLTMTLSTSNNGNATVFASYTVPSVTNSSWTVSDANTSQTIAQLAFTNSNGLTLSLSTSNNGHATVIGSYTVPNVPAATSWTVSDAVTSQTIGRLAFTNANGLTMTLSTSNNGNATVVGSYTVPAVTHSSWTASDANTSMTIAQLNFTNSNGMTLSMVTSNNGHATLVGSYTVPNVPAATSWTVSDAVTSQTIGRLAFTNANGLTMTLSTSNNGNATVFGSYTVPTVTNSAWTVSDAVTSQTVGRLAFTNANGMTMTLSTSNNGNATVFASYTVPSVPAATSWTVSDAVTSQTIGRLAFTNANGMTMTLSTSNNGNATVFASYTVPTVTNSAWTVSDAVTSQTIGRLAFTNANGLSMTLSTSNNGNATVVGSYTVPTVTNSSLSLTADNGSSIGSLSRLYFQNSNNVSFGLSTSNNGSATLTASVPAPITLSQFEIMPLWTGSGVVSGNATQINMQPFILDNNLSISKMNILKSFSMASNTSSSNSSYSASWAYTQSATLWVRSNGGAGSSNIITLFTTTVSFAFSSSVTSNNWSVGATWLTNTATNGFGTTTWSSASTGTGISSYWTGLKPLIVPMQTYLSAGEYWLGLQASSGLTTAGINSAPISISDVFVTKQQTSIGDWGRSAGSILASNISNQGFGQATNTTATTMALTNANAGNANPPHPIYVNFSNYPNI